MTTHVSNKNDVLTNAFIDEFADIWFAFMMLHENKLNWNLMSANPNATTRIITKNKNKPWNFNHMDNNPNITMEFILSNSNEPWNKYGISKHKNIMVEVDLEPDDKPFDIHKTDNISPDEFYKNIINKQETDTKLLDKMQNIRNSLQKQIDEMCFCLSYVTNYRGISQNPNVTQKHIVDNPEKKWDWAFVSYNPNIDMDFILQHPNKEWDWNAISKNTCITMKDILQHPDKPWDWSAISKNPSITMDDILQNPTERWNGNLLSYNPNITTDFILMSEYNKQWSWFSEKCDWYGVSQNPNITLNDILNNPDLPWDWNGISFNPNIPIDFIVNTPYNPWNYYLVSRNTFEFDKIMFIEQKRNWLFVVTLFDYYSSPQNYDEHLPYSKLEQILSDDYLVKNISKY